MKALRYLTLILAAGLLLSPALSAQSQELNCFVSDPDTEGMTNIRSAPKGTIVHQLEAAGFYQLTAIVQPGGWWRIKDGIVYDEGGCEEKVPGREAWIHRSVLAVATDYEDGQVRKLYAEPRRDAKRVMAIHEIRALLRPLELSADGKWVKVTYDPSEFEGRPCEKVTGWIEKSQVRDDAFEPGDGGPVPLVYVSAPGKERVICREKPVDGAQTFFLEKGKAYEFWVSNPKTAGGSSGTDTSWRTTHKSGSTTRPGCRLLRSIWSRTIITKPRRFQSMRNLTLNHAKCLT